MASFPAMASPQSPTSPLPTTKNVVVVGGGWAGFGAAHALSKAGLSVTLLDAAPYPGGLSTGYRTPQGRPVEAGIKGFWWQYNNIYELVRELGIQEPFTDWTRSTFYSPDGIQVEAPVFNALPRLPTPLGSFIYTSPYFRSLSVVDRLTALPLIKALIEFDVVRHACTQICCFTFDDNGHGINTSIRSIRIHALLSQLCSSLFLPVK